MFMKYSSFEYSEFILASQLQFGAYEAESEHFRWEREQHQFNEWFSRANCNLRKMRRKMMFGYKIKAIRKLCIRECINDVWI